MPYTMYKNFIFNLFIIAYISFFLAYFAPYIICWKSKNDTFYQTLIDEQSLIINHETKRLYTYFSLI